MEREGGPFGRLFCGILELPASITLALGILRKLQRSNQRRTNFIAIVKMFFGR
jgi:hypothetical protein